LRVERGFQLRVERGFQISRRTLAATAGCASSAIFRPRAGAPTDFDLAVK